MTSDRKEQIIDLLTKYDLAGTPFTQAKEELLSQGFTDAEIAIGLYAAPFDGKDNRTRTTNPLEKLYAEHPEEANKVARSLMLENAQKDLRSTATSMVASQFAPGPHAQTRFESAAADSLGISYFAMILVAAVFLVLILKFDIPNDIVNIFLGVASIALASYVAYKFIRKWLHVRSLRDK